MPTESNMAEKAQEKVQSGSGAAGGGELDATPGGAHQRSSIVSQNMHRQTSEGGFFPDTNQAPKLQAGLA